MDVIGDYDNMWGAQEIFYNTPKRAYHALYLDNFVWIFGTEAKYFNCLQNNNNNNNEQSFARGVGGLRRNCEKNFVWELLNEPHSLSY